MPFSRTNSFSAVDNPRNSFSVKMLFSNFENLSCNDTYIIFLSRCFGLAPTFLKLNLCLIDNAKLRRFPACCKKLCDTLVPTSFLPCDGGLSALRQQPFRLATAALSARDGGPFAGRKLSFGRAVRGGGRNR